MSASLQHMYFPTNQALEDPILLTRSFGSKSMRRSVWPSIDTQPPHIVFPEFAGESVAWSPGEQTCQQLSIGSNTANDRSALLLSC
jgi:hypothetical protein